MSSKRFYITISVVLFFSIIYNVLLPKVNFHEDYNSTKFDSVLTLLIIESESQIDDDFNKLYKKIAYKQDIRLFSDQFKSNYHSKEKLFFEIIPKNLVTKNILKKFFSSRFTSDV